MGYVKTAEEVAEIESFFARPLFTRTGITVEFETTTDFVRSVLPPCLRHVDPAVGFVSVGTWQSRAVGEFDSACVFVAAEFDGRVGFYTLTMLVSGDMPIAWGRELWGEAKKAGTIGYFADGDDRYAYGERNGTRLIEVEASLGSDEGARTETHHAFEIKAFPAATGFGLEFDPKFLDIEATTVSTVTRSGTGTLQFRGTSFDPLDTIPLISVGRVTETSGESIWEVKQVRTLDEPDSYVPYVYGRNFDDLRAFPVPRRFRNLTPQPVERA